MGHETRRSHQHVAIRARLGLLLATAALNPTGAAADATLGNCAVVAALPPPPATAKVFSSRSGADDAADIQHALDGLHSGDWLVLAAGHYLIGKHLVIAGDGVTLYGKGAVIRSSSPRDGGVLIEGDDVAVYGLTLEQDSVERQGAPWSGGIAIFDGRGGRRRRVSGATIEGNTINNAAAAGIFLYKASYFTVAGNSVFRSLADGIHATGGSKDGRIVGNSVTQNGDDMVAIVSYAGLRNTHTLAARYPGMSADDLDSNIYVAGNKLSDTYWGRGISVVGGSDVTIENNDISRTPTAAGIYLLRESSYVTYGDHNILVRANSLSQIQTMAPTYKPPGITLVLTHHGAVEVSSQLLAEESTDTRFRQPLSVSGIALIGNKIHDARFAGVRLGAVSESDKTVSDVLVQDNSLAGVGADAVAEVHPGMDRASLTCSGNKLNGTLWQSACDKVPVAATARPAISGASLTCLPDGTIRRQVVPRAPTDLR